MPACRDQTERAILGGRDLTYGEVLAAIAKVAGCRAPSWVVPCCRGYRFSSDKARRELGYSPGAIEPAIADAIAWFRDHGKLHAATS